MVAGVLHGLQEQRLDGTCVYDFLLRVVRAELADAVGLLERTMTAEAAGDHATADRQFRTGLVLTRGVVDRLRSAAGRR